MAALCACSNEALPPTPTPPTPANYEPEGAKLQRLLARQYLNSVERLLGSGARLAAMPPADTKLHGFASIAAREQALTDNLVSEYEASALAVATAAMGNTARIEELLDCEPDNAVDTPCHRAFVVRFGRLAFRRALTTEEVADYVALSTRAAEELGDFYAGTRFVIAAMLQSPNFLFRVELGQDDLSAPNTRRLTRHELASRLSFFLHDTTPSEALLDAADDGLLDDEAGIRQAAQMLIAQPEARDALLAFFEEYLDLEGMDHLAKDPHQFPQFTPQFAASMRDETLRLVADVVWTRNVPITQLFNADYTFVDAALAEHYGTWQPSNAAWTRMSLPADQERSGILTHASILSKQAHPGSTSATYRGLFVMERFLCKTMEPPPAGVVTELPPTSIAPTLRERIAVHLEDPNCAACHQISDRLGLALENFDAIGLHREEENGAPIDAHVDVPGIGAFNGARGLGTALAAKPEVTRCILRQVLRNTRGFVETDSEETVITALDAAFDALDHRLKDMLVEIAASEMFRTVAPPAEDDPSEDEVSP